MESLPDVHSEYAETVRGRRSEPRVKLLPAIDASQHHSNMEAKNVDISKRAHSVVVAVAKAGEEGLRAERVGTGRYEVPSRSRTGHKWTVGFSTGRASCGCPSRTTCAHIGAVLLLLGGAYD